jgi:hypothetical protein
MKVFKHLSMTLVIMLLLLLGDFSILMSVMNAVQEASNKFSINPLLGECISLLAVFMTFAYIQFENSILSPENRSGWSSIWRRGLYIVVSVIIANCVVATCGQFVPYSFRAWTIITILPLFIYLEFRSRLRARLLCLTY